MRRIILLIIVLALNLPPWMLSAAADEPEGEEARPIPEIETFDIPEEELMAIIDRADNFFFNQDIQNMAVDLVIYRDPLRELTLDDLKSGDVEYKARLSPIITHYFYKAPGWYQLKIMGMILISSETCAPTSMTSLLPLPGGQINIPAVLDNYDITYLGPGEVNGRRTHRVRLSAKNYKAQFIKYSIYDFDVEEGYLGRIESHFNDGCYFMGHGSGEFYYGNRSGKLLPSYGYGEIFIFPCFHITLWGTWFKWEFNAEDFMTTLTRGEEDEFKPIDLGES